MSLSDIATQYSGLLLKKYNHRLLPGHNKGAESHTELSNPWFRNDTTGMHRLWSKRSETHVLWAPELQPMSKHRHQ